jgi:histidine kinase
MPAADAGVQPGVNSSGGVSLVQVASGISHQIIDPLSVVLNNVKVLKIKFAQKKEFSYADLKEQIAFIEESAVLCKNIISSFSCASSGTKVSLQNMQLNEVIEKVYLIKNQEFKFKNITFQKQLQQDVPSIMGDALLLQQVIFNIIANAKWAIEQKPQRDGGIIGLGTQHEQAMNKVIVTISDTGIGIKEADLPRIFEPLFTTKRIEEGIGLGLSIVADIIKAHQASISVESKEGQGTAFRIVFPALPAPKST